MDAALAQTTTIDPKNRIASPEVRRLVEGVVRRRVPAMEVEDVVQTVLCDALASESVPDDEEQLRKWIVGITRHKVADFHRKGSRAKHVELPEAVEGEEAPLSAREWARWAEQQTEGNPEAKRTLDWMAREGGGEKLAHIAEEEELPATQVRQRVSRLRRFMKQRWAAELAAVAAIVILALIAWRLLRDDEPIAVPEPVPEVTPDPKALEAQRMRADALAQCRDEAWEACVEGLDAAKQLDPAGDEAPEVQQARGKAAAALEEQKQRNEDGKKDPDRSDEPPTKVAPPKAPPINLKNAPPSSVPTEKAPRQKKLPTRPAPAKPSPKKSSTFDDPFGPTNDAPPQTPPQQEAPSQMPRQQAPQYPQKSGLKTKK